MTKEAAKKAAAAQPAPETPEAEQPPVEASPSIENAAPLEPPADEPDETDEATEATEDEADDAELEDGDEDGDEDGQADSGDVKDPATATLEPPAEQPKDDSAVKPSTSLTDAAAERLRNITKQEVLVRDDANQPIEDAEGLFVGPGPDGQMVVTKRLHQHTTQTAFDRPVVTLLLAKGQRISEHGARTILSRIQAERA